MLEALVVFALILLNGVFALSEIALVSARKPRLKAMAEAGNQRAGQAYALAADPGRFLSTVQIGITLVGVLAGAFSGSTLGVPLSEFLVDCGVAVKFAGPTALGVVVAGVTYLSIVVGELAPKQIALRNPEKVACAVAPGMAMLSRLAAPAVWILDASTRSVFHGFGGMPAQESSEVTEADLKAVVAEAESAGAIESAERRMISGVLRLGDRPVRGVMTPRGEVDWLNAAASPDEIRRILAKGTHSRLPVGDGEPDAMIGVVQTRDLLAALIEGRELDIRGLCRRAPVVPDTAEALDVLETLREAETPMALVLDEYGHFEGIVTPSDLTVAIVGGFRADATGDNDIAAQQKDDGSWLLAGWMPADEMAENLGVTLPVERGYATVAGFVLAAMGRLPAVGETFSAAAWTFEILAVDGRRVERVHATPAIAPAGQAA